MPTTTEPRMTYAQVGAMLAFHRRAEAAYLASGQKLQAKRARELRERLEREMEQKITAMLNASEKGEGR